MLTFEGIQPTFKHVPPSVSFFSMQTVYNQREHYLITGNMQFYFPKIPNICLNCSAKQATQRVFLQTLRANPADPKLQDLHDTGNNRISERSPSEDPVLIV